MQSVLTKSYTHKGVDYLVKSLGIAFVPICLYLVLPYSEARFSFEVVLLMVSLILGLIGAIMWMRMGAFSQLAVSTRMKRVALIAQHVASVLIIGFNVALFERVRSMMAG